MLRVEPLDSSRTPGPARNAHSQALPCAAVPETLAVGLAGCLFTDLGIWCPTEGETTGLDSLALAKRRHEQGYLQEIS